MAFERQQNSTCANSSEVKAFYKRNNKMNFMFIDQYTDYKDVDVIFKSFVNTANYVTTDPESFTFANYFVRKWLIKADEYQDGTADNE